MTARVITVTSGKGGVGKTTATANLAVALASLGNRVCCIDADIGLRNLDIVLGLENRIVYDLVDVVEGRAKLRQAMIKDKRVDELYLIPAAQTRDKTAVSPSDMIRICDELRSMVDYIVIDSPAGIERGFRNALAPADMVVIVTNPEVSSVRDADRIIGLIEAEGKGPANLVINRVKPEMVKRGDMLSPEDVIDILAIKLIGLVPEDEGILVSTNRGLPASLGGDSRAGQAFRNIARRIMGEHVPFMSMEENKSWTQRLLKAFGLGEKEDKPISTPPAPVLTPTRAAPVNPPAPAPAPSNAPASAPASRATSTSAPASAPAAPPAAAPVPASPPVTPAAAPAHAPAVTPAVVPPASQPASSAPAPANAPASAPASAHTAAPMPASNTKPSAVAPANAIPVMPPAGASAAPAPSPASEPPKAVEMKPAQARQNSPQPKDDDTKEHPTVPASVSPASVDGKDADTRIAEKKDSNGKSAGAGEANPVASNAGSQSGS